MICSRFAARTKTCSLLAVLIVLFAFSGCGGGGGGGIGPGPGGDGPPTLWTFTFGYSGADYGWQVLETPDGGAVLTGDAQTVSNGRRLHVVFINSQGILENAQMLGDYVLTPRAMHPTFGNDYVIGAGVMSGNATIPSFVRVDSIGFLEREVLYQSPLDGDFFDMIPTADNGYLMLSTTRRGGFGNIDMFVRKIDSEGVEQWTRNYGDTGDEYGRTIIPTSTGDFLIAGSMQQIGLVYTDQYIVMIDSDGNFQWSNFYPFTDDQAAYSALQVTDGYLLLGYTDQTGGGDDDVLLTKIDTGGELLWQKTYGGIRDDRGTQLVEDTDGNILILGYTHSFSDGYRDAYLIKVDRLGEVIWETYYGGNQDDTPRDLVLHSQGGYLLAGSSESYGDGYSDMWLLRLGEVE